MKVYLTPIFIELSCGGICELEIIYVDIYFYGLSYLALQ